MQPNNSSFFLGPDDAKQACLLIHGFSGTPTEMRGLGQMLAQHGIRSYGMTIPGHGEDAEALIHSGHKAWIAAAEEALALLSRHSSVFVAGFSLGGVLALHLAQHHPERVVGVIALSTPTRFTGGWPVRLVPLARYFVQWFYPLARADFSDPKVQIQVLSQARLRDPQAKIDFSDAQTVASIKQMVRLPVPAIAELFSLTNKVRRKLAKLHRPLLILQGKRDQTVDPQCADELYRLATSAHPKELHWLPDADHMITTGPERQLVYRYVLDFIDTLTARQEL